MIKSLLFAITLTLISSCSRDENPVIDVKIEMNQSDKFQSALISTNSFSFFSMDPDTKIIETSIIQQWRGIEIDQDLTKNETNSILIEEHWTIDLLGVKPQISMIINENGENNDIEIDYIDFIALPEITRTEENKEYEIIIEIDTDNAIEKTNEKYKLNWDFVTARIHEK